MSEPEPDRDDGIDSSEQPKADPRKSLWDRVTESSEPVEVEEDQVLAEVERLEAEAKGTRPNDEKRPPRPDAGAITDSVTTVP